MKNVNTDRRIAIVTGAGGAIGRAIATRLAEDGLIVAAADLSEDRVAAVCAGTGEPGQVFPLVMDMGDCGSIASAVSTVEARFGRIDVIVNNAAVNHRGSIGDFDPEKWDHMFAVNVRGPAYFCQRMVPIFTRQKSGRIINIASRSWVAGGPPAYVACKAGIVGLTRSAARELAPLNVTVNAVAPGLVPSAFTMDGRSEDMFSQITARSIAATPMGRLTEARDVANAVSFFASDDASYVTAEVLHVCGGSQLAPLGGGNNT